MGRVQRVAEDQILFFLLPSNELGYLLIMSYKIVRYYFNKPGYKYTIKRGLSLDEAQAHCSDKETSSSTCTNRAGVARTKRVGPWFDAYTDAR